MNTIVIAFVIIIASLGVFFLLKHFHKSNPSSSCGQLNYGCADASECCKGLTCNNNTCSNCKKQSDTCKSNNECCNGLICDSNNTCSNCKKQSDTCKSPSECCDGLSCQNNTCIVPSVNCNDTRFSYCKNGSDCCNPMTCNDGYCYNKTECNQLNNNCNDDKDCCANLFCINNNNTKICDYKLCNSNDDCPQPLHCEKANASFPLSVCSF